MKVMSKMNPIQFNFSPTAARRWLASTIAPVTLTMPIKSVQKQPQHVTTPCLHKNQQHESNTKRLSYPHASARI